MSDIYTGPSAGQIASAVRNELLEFFQSISMQIEETNGNVCAVDNRVSEVDDSLSALKREFRSYVFEQRKANRLNQAETRVGTIRQKLEKLYGHYDGIRRTVVGILEASDLGLVRQATVTSASEELFISTPRYWLAPCLVALAAWINDNEPLAKLAIKEAVKRNAENSALFFALVTRRADRFAPSLLWVNYYLSLQNEESLNRNALVVLEALVSGIWGNDAEGVVSDQISEWIERLQSRDSFYEDQVKSWKDILESKGTQGSRDYVELPARSPEWKAIDETLQGAERHAAVRSFFRDIFDQKTTAEAEFKTMLDNALTMLVTNFDEEEYPLRKEERLETLVIQFKGDEDRALDELQLNKDIFEARTDLGKLLLDAVALSEDHGVTPELQKFAVALSKYYIYDAYNDLAAKNRSHVPRTISGNLESQSFNTKINGETADFEIPEFSAKTIFGDNERELVDDYSDFIENNKKATIAKFEKMYADAHPHSAAFWYIWGAVSLVLAIPSFALFVILGILVSICCIICFYKGAAAGTHLEELNEVTIPTVRKTHKEAKKAGIESIRALCAEVVDYRDEFSFKDAEAQPLLDYIESLESSDYIRVRVKRRRAVAA